MNELLSMLAFGKIIAKEKGGQDLYSWASLDNYRKNEASSPY